MSYELNKPIHGRGALTNPSNRFEKIEWTPDPEADPTEEPSPRTEFFADTARSIITFNDSPDVGFSAGMSPYRGCEHGCVYCYARPNHEYLGLSAGLDFETKIFVKKDAPELLRKELFSRKWKPQPVALSGNTDVYQPIERRLKITKSCLDIFKEFRNPVSIITKNRLITRDIDILKDLAAFNCVLVFISVTTLDHALSRCMEPRASRPLDRLTAIEQLSKTGIPVGVLVAPVIPALTDHEIPAILKESAKRGARWAGHVILRLPFGVKFIFEEWLLQNFPERKEKILNRIKDLRGGKLNDSRFGSRMSGEGVYAQQIHDLFSISCKREGLNHKPFELTTDHFRKAKTAQLTLFE